MTLAAFRLLLPRAQLLLVMTEGTYLAYRRGEKGHVMNLYYLPDKGQGFFVEIGFNNNQDSLIVLCSFNSSVLLEEYTQGVILPA